MQSRNTSRQRTAGMTLIELMIAVAIVGMLAAIAYPSYQAQVRRGDRADGKAELMKAAQEMEKCFTRYGAYNNAACNSYNAILNGNRLSEAGKYLISFTPNSVQRNTYILQAARQAAFGPDPECGILTVNQSGVRTRSGNAPMDRCW